MIKANQRVFAILQNFIEQSGTEYPYPPDVTRYIKTDSKEQKWLKRLTIAESYELLPTLKFATMKLDSNNYFAAVGWEISTDIAKVLAEILEPTDLNAGIVTALIADFSVGIRDRVNPNDILNEVLFLYKESDNKYTGHEYTDLIKFFRPFNVYKISKKSPFNSDNLFRITGFYICKNYKKLTLNFSPETRLLYEKIFLEGPEPIPYEGLVQSLITTQWKYSFLDLYRCIEQLFPIIKLEELHTELSLTKPLLEFASLVETIMEWKAKEEASIKKLIDTSPEDATLLLREVKEHLDSNPDGDLGSRVYKIRNQVVHFRPSIEKLEIDEENWDKLIRAILMVMHSSYSKYESKLK